MMPCHPRSGWENAMSYNWVMWQPRYLYSASIKGSERKGLNVRIKNNQEHLWEWSIFQHKSHINFLSINDRFHNNSIEKNLPPILCITIKIFWKSLRYADNSCGNTLWTLIVIWNYLYWILSEDGRSCMKTLFSNSDRPKQSSDNTILLNRFQQRSHTKFDQIHSTTRSAVCRSPFLPRSPPEHCCSRWDPQLVRLRQVLGDWSQNLFRPVVCQWLKYSPAVSFPWEGRVWRFAGEWHRRWERSVW